MFTVYLNTTISLSAVLKKQILNFFFSRWWVWCFIFTTYIRPIVKIVTQVWNRHHRWDNDCIKNVQKRFTKFLPGLFIVAYLTKLVTLNLKSFEAYRIINDILYIFKTIRNLADLTFYKYISWCEGQWIDWRYGCIFVLFCMLYPDDLNELFF